VVALQYGNVIVVASWFHYHTWIVLCAEMVSFMKHVAGMDVELTVEERNLLSVAYKNVIGARRASWRIISSIEQKEDKGGSTAKTEQTVEYRKMVRRHRHYHSIRVMVPSSVWAGWMTITLSLPKVEWWFRICLLLFQQFSAAEQAVISLTKCENFELKSKCVWQLGFIWTC